MKIAVIGKNIRDSKVPAFVKGLFRKVETDVVCEIVEISDLTANFKYLAKMDGIIILNTFNHEIKEFVKTNLEHVDVVRIIGDSFLTYNIQEFLDLKCEKNSIAHTEYYTALQTYRILTSLLDFESSKAEEIYERIIKLNISDNRMTHILSVCYFGKLINMANNLNCDIEKIEVAALLHDVTKEERLSDAEAINYGLLDLPKQAWHAVTGMLKAKNEYNVDDQEILDAIRYHTTGRGDMTVLDEIINLSDFCEPTRDYIDCIKARNVSLTNYKQGLAIKYVRLNDLRDGSLTQDNIDAYNKYKEYL